MCEVGTDLDDLTGIYPDNAPGAHPYNRCARYNSVNRNKRGLILDLGQAEGKRLFLDLVRQADVVAENFSARDAELLGSTTPCKA